MRKSHMTRAFATVFVCLMLALCAGAQELSVRNKPYKGECRGRGVDMLVRLDEMAKALDMPAVKTEAGWTLGGTAIPTTDEGGVVLIKLSDLTAVGAKVTHNKEFNTIDVNRPVAKSNAPSGAGYTMVHWTADW